jgi:hypothetical protein
MIRSKCLTALFVSLLVCVGATHAADSAPTAASVKELLTVMGSRQLIESTLARADDSLRTTLAQMVSGEPSAEEQAILDDLRSQSIVILREAMQWETLEPQFVEIYQTSFTQDEVNGMLEFYRSEAGRAVIAKMPGAMQRTSVVMQELVNGMMPRLRDLQIDAIAKLRAVQEKKPGG